MNSPPDAVYARVRDTDPDALDADELSTYLRDVATLESWCQARKVRATRRQRALASEGRATDPRHSLTEHGRQSSKEARAADEREAVCTAMPGFEDALSTGAVSAGHVDAVATATRGLDDEERAEFTDAADDLLADAGRLGVDAFGRSCRELARSIRARHNSRAEVDELERQRRQSKVTRWVDGQTGMHKTLIECDPVTDRAIWSAVQHVRGRLRRRRQDRTTTWDRLTVDAVVAAVSGGAAQPGQPGATIVVHTELAALTRERDHDVLCETDSGTAIPVETMRRLACEAGIIPMVLNGAGAVLDEGRAKRLATPEQRRAIEAMQATCSHPQCTVSVDDCRIHHLDVWASGGRSDLDRMAPLCEPHHHLVHEGGWRFTMSPDRFGTWVRPDGVIEWQGSLLDRRPAEVA